MENVEMHKDEQPINIVFINLVFIHIQIDKIISYITAVLYSDFCFILHYKKTCINAIDYILETTFYGHVLKYFTLFSYCEIYIFFQSPANFLLISKSSNIDEAV